MLTRCDSLMRTYARTEPYPEFTAGGTPWSVIQIPIFLTGSPRSRRTLNCTCPSKVDSDTDRAVLQFSVPCALEIHGTHVMSSSTMLCFFKCHILESIYPIGWMHANAHVYELFLHFVHVGAVGQQLRAPLRRTETRGVQRAGNGLW